MVEAFVSRQIELAKEEGSPYLVYCGFNPPMIDGNEVSLNELLTYCRKKGYSYHFLDEMDRPLGKMFPPTSWDEFDRLIIKF